MLNADFDRRHLWAAHILQHHWRTWSCPFKCEGSFPFASELRRHLSVHHMPGVPEEQLNAATTLGEKPAANDTATACPVCLHTVVGSKQYIKHVGRHLEQLALFALPSIEAEDDSDEDEVDVESDQIIDDQKSTGSRASSDNPEVRFRSRFLCFRWVHESGCII